MRWLIEDLQVYRLSPDVYAFTVYLRYCLMF